MCGCGRKLVNHCAARKWTRPVLAKQHLMACSNEIRSAGVHPSIHGVRRPPGSPPRIRWMNVLVPRGLPSTISHKLSKPTSCAAKKKHHHVVRHRLWTLLRCIDDPCLSMISSSKCKKQPRKPWHHNQTKRNGSLGRK